MSEKVETKTADQIRVDLTNSYLMMCDGKITYAEHHKLEEQEWVRKEDYDNLVERYEARGKTIDDLLIKIEKKGGGKV